MSRKHGALKVVEQVENVEQFNEQPEVEQVVEAVHSEPVEIGAQPARKLSALEKLQLKIQKQQEELAAKMLASKNYARDRKVKSLRNQCEKRLEQLVNIKANQYATADRVCADRKAELDEKFNLQSEETRKAFDQLIADTIKAYDSTPLSSLIGHDADADADVEGVDGEF